LEEAYRDQGVMRWLWVLLFVLGFLTRAAIGWLSAATWQWRVNRAFIRELKKCAVPGKVITIMRWRVTLSRIQWDSGKGEYDVSQLPTELTLIVHAEDEDTALEYALSDASADQGSLIDGVGEACVEPVINDVD
jgi:hypothetical protein